MKKLMSVVIVFFILTSGLDVKKHFTLLDYFQGEYTVYSSRELGENSVNLGFCYMDSKPVKDYVLGESMKITNFEIGNALKVLNAHVVKTECLENGSTVIYAYSNLIQEKVEVENKFVNLQIVENEEYCIIGWPLILGSY